MGKKTKQTKQKSSADESLLAEVAKLRADNFLLSSPAGLTTVGPLPSTAGGNAAPVNTPSTAITPTTTTTTPVPTTPVQPTSGHSSTSASFRDDWATILNQGAIDKVNAENDAETARVDNMNSLLPAEMKRLNDDFATKPKGGGYDSAGSAQMYELSPAMPLPTMPRLKEVPREVVGNFSRSEAKAEKQGYSDQGKPKLPPPVIPTIDFVNGSVSSVSPSNVKLDIQSGVRASNEYANPSMGKAVIDDTWSTSVVPNGVTAKMPMWMYNPKTGKYENNGIQDVPIGGATMADNARRIFTAYMADAMMGDINSKKGYTYKDKDGKLVTIPLVSNYGASQGASQLQFSPRVFVEKLGGDWNTVIANAASKTREALGLPNGANNISKGSAAAAMIAAGGNAGDIWARAKDHDIEGETINGLGNSMINGLFSMIFGVK